MRVRVLFAAALSLGLLALIAGRALAEDPKGKPADSKAGAKDAGGKDAHGMDPAMIEKWMKAATPGQQHAQLKAMEGKWNITTKMRHTPDMPWEEDKGTADIKMVLGGRYIEQEVKGTKTEMGMPPFEGHGFTGYDNMKKEFFNIWFDNMGTSYMMSTGKSDESGKTITMTSEFDCPIQGHQKVRTVTRMISPDKMVFEMYGNAPDGKEFLHLEVTYTKKS